MNRSHLPRFFLRKIHGIPCHWLVFPPYVFFGHFSDLRLDLDGAGTVDFEELLGFNESKLTLPS